MVISWIENAIKSLGFSLESLSFVFCDDEYLKKINSKYLNHNYYTDVVTFDYSKKKEIKGDIFISIERVKENAIDYKVSFNEELFRVIIHGVLHLCGFNDNTVEEKTLIRSKENEFLSTINWKTGV